MASIMKLECSSENHATPRGMPKSTACMGRGSIPVIHLRHQGPRDFEDWGNGHKYFPGENYIQGVFFTGAPLKVPSTKKSILARLGVSWPSYVAVDSPNLGFPYFNFLGGYQLNLSKML